MGRAVLPDYLAPAKPNKVSYSPPIGDEITFGDLEAVIVD